MGHSTNVFGCGKSTFGQEYIWRCQSLKPDPRVPDFMDTLRNYHTMPIKFETDHVLDENGDFDCYLTSQSLVECLRDSSKRSWSNLLPFGRDSIKTITKRTRWEETKSESIQDELQLTEEQVTLAADHLLDTTFGHPRSLQLALEKCQSYDDLLTYTTK
ncbi:hypothetical protein DVH05_017130 [Phytophthora capsici]|nr:hypothetical protein DVH05_017130 [Phytophthora capsici]